MAYKPSPILFYFVLVLLLAENIALGILDAKAFGRHCSPQLQHTAVHTSQSNLKHK
jgi:hypothetical protein